jgi:hypothetical protein
MFAGRCASMDAAALASVRVMPQCMSMGQAAGLAASMALRENKLPREIDVQALRRALLEQGAVLCEEQIGRIPVNTQSSSIK